MHPSNPPDGFVPHFRDSGLTDPWKPLFSRFDGDAVIIGLRAGPAHANSRGLVHGGLIMALADNAMGLSCGRAGGASGLVTVALTTEFLGVARLGQWVEIRPRVLKAGRSLCFAAADIVADGVACAHASATFKTAACKTATCKTAV